MDNRYDTIQEAEQGQKVKKFNPFHDALGRFASSGNFSSYSANPKTKAGRMAIERSYKAGHTKTFNRHKESKGENVLQNYQWMTTGKFSGRRKPVGYSGKTSSNGHPRKKPQASTPVKTPSKPTVNRDKRGFADHDSAGYHKLHSGAKYYAQQKLTTKEKNAVNSYLESHREPGSLYSHSQNMNYMMANGQKLTGKYKQTHDGMMSAMHNIGYNVELTRYDHSPMINSVLKTIGAGTNYENMSEKQLQKALVGKTIGENKFISTTYNDFSKAGSSASTFSSRAVKINYKVKANTQAMMPGKGPGGDFGEIVLAPTNGQSNQPGKITGVRFTGKMARRQGTQSYNQPQIEIDIEIG